MSTLKEEALQLHEVHQGKLAVSLKVDIETKHDLSLAYTPGWRSRAWRSHRIGSRYTDIRAREMLWPSLPTERRCWVWGISARRRPCR